MTKKLRPFWILLMGLCAGSLLGAGGAVFADKSDTDAALERLPLDDLRVFTEVVDRIKKSYVDDVDDRELFRSAIDGMLSGLDPHSAYLDPEAFEDLQVSTSGEFGGLGIEVSMENGFVKVVAPIDDTPAQRAGLEAGDLIIKLDETPVKGLNLREAVNIMRGAKGAPIILTVVRKGADQPLECTIVRDVIRVRSVRSRLLEEDYGYVRISQFQVQTGQDLRDHIEKLSSEGELKGLVLDLRNNPGGVLKAAVDVADTFITEGTLVYTEGRIPNADLSFSAQDTDWLNGAPVAILVNGGSASASEIVAGAIQDHKRGIVIGTDTFGKGSVQTVLPLHDNRALKITTALYYTPNGRSIQAEGIKPDIQVERAKLTREEGRFSGFKEADLQGHLENGNKEGEANPTENSEDSSVEEAQAAAEEDADLAEEDYQLYEALNILKAVNILGSR